MLGRIFALSIRLPPTNLRYNAVQVWRWTGQEVAAVKKAENDEPQGQESKAEPTALAVPPPSRCLEGAILAVANGKKFIDDARRVLEGGGHPSSAAALAVHGLEELGKGFIWAVSVTIKQRAAGSALRQGVTDSHVQRLWAGFMLCFQASFLQAVREHLGSRIDDAMAVLNSLSPEDQEDMLANVPTGMETALLAQGLDLRAFFEGWAKDTQERAAAAGVVNQDVAMAFARIMRSRAFYVDWDPSTQSFVTPDAFYAASAVTSLVDEFSAASAIAERFVEGLMEAERTGHMSRIHKAAKRSSWFLEMLGEPTP